MEVCKTLAPKVRDMGNGHFVRCHLFDDGIEARKIVENDEKSTKERLADEAKSKEKNAAKA
jgi:hypothetical protein